MKPGKHRVGEWQENSINVDRFHGISSPHSFDKNMGILFCDEQLS